MKIEYFKLKLDGSSVKLRVIAGRYENGNKAYQLVSFSRGEEEDFADITVNPGVLDELGAVWVKTWGENSEIFEALVKGGYLDPIGVECPCGYARAAACRITKKLAKYIQSDFDQD